MNFDCLFDAKFQDLLTPLHISAHYGNTEAAEALLQLKCDVDAKALVRVFVCFLCFCIVSLMQFFSVLLTVG